MSVLYAKKPNQFIKDFKKFYNEHVFNSKTINIVTFHKINKHVYSMLNIIFPKVLVNIITEYNVDTIPVDYVSFSIYNEYIGKLYEMHRSLTFRIKIKIIPYDFEMSISFTSAYDLYFRDVYHIIHPNFVMSGSIYKNTFGCNEYMNPFRYFNHFMLKYYGKKQYFTSFFSNSKDTTTPFKYKNPRQLKHVIIIVKILTEYIQYAKL